MAQLVTSRGCRVGDYILEAPIGTGAGSIIYRARHARTGRLYAIKVVGRTDKGNDKYLRQVQNEFEIAADFKHPNLVQILDLIRRRGLVRLRACCLVMELVRGEPLSRKDDLSFEAAVYVFCDIAAALVYIHENGYVHADVKPSNVLVRDDGVAKLCDFGLIGPASVRRGRVQGTMDFAAPEQLVHKMCDAKTDVYSLGATMYRVLSGYNLPSRAAVQRQVKFGTSYVRFPSFYRKDVPPALDELVLACCRIDRAKRPESVQEVHARLTAIARAAEEKREEGLEES